MNKRLLIITVTVAITTLFITTGIYAGTEVKDDSRWKTRLIKNTKRAYKYLPTRST